MGTLTANESIQAWLGQIKERTEIRGANGEMLGIFDPRSETEDELYERANVLGTMNILEAARSGSVENIVLASSSSVYGSQPPQMWCSPEFGNRDRFFGTVKIGV